MTWDCQISWRRYGRKWDKKGIISQAQEQGRRGKNSIFIFSAIAIMVSHRNNRPKINDSLPISWMFLPAPLKTAASAAEYPHIILMRNHFIAASDSSIAGAKFSTVTKTVGPCVMYKYRSIIIQFCGAFIYTVCLPNLYLHQSPLISTGLHIFFFQSPTMQLRKPSL